MTFNTIPTHENPELFCPHCFKRLKRVIRTGFTYCPSDVTCDYEVYPDSVIKPLTAEERESLQRLGLINESIKKIGETIENLRKLQSPSLNSMLAKQMQLRDMRDKYFAMLPPRLRDLTGKYQ